MGRPKLNLTNRVCSVCKVDKEITEFRKRTYCKDCENKKQVEYREKNREKVREIKKEWRKKNRDKENERTRKWKSENPEKVKKRRNDYLKERRKKDPKFKMIEAMRRMLRRCLTQKTNRTSKMLGYNPEELKTHLESLFTEGMSWDNYGEWHIDHIKPISEFEVDTPPHIVNELKNLQPLWSVNKYINGNWYEGNLNKGTTFLT